VGLARVAYGGVADRPVRLSSVEQCLLDRALNRELIEEVVDLAMRAVSPMSDVRASAEYRRQMVGALLRESLEQCLEREDAIIG
jgi:carbon-monoxide dehydrogenase medium subunit